MNYVGIKMIHTCLTNALVKLRVEYNAIQPCFVCEVNHQAFFIILS